MQLAKRRPRRRRNIRKFPIPQIRVKHSRLPVTRPQILALHFRIHMPIHNQNSRPTGIIKIKKLHPPPKPIPHRPQPRPESHIIKQYSSRDSNKA